MEINIMVAKFVSAAAVLSMAGAATAAPFSVLSVDMGNINGQTGLFGSPISVQGGTLFNPGGIDGGNARNLPPAQGTTNEFFLQDSYAGLDGGQLVGNSQSTAGPAGPTFGGNSSTYPPILGYQSNNSFSFVPYAAGPGSPFGTDNQTFGWGWFTTSAEQTTNFAGQGHRIFLGQLTVLPDPGTRASLTGGTANILLGHFNGNQAAGGFNISVDLGGSTSEGFATNDPQSTITAADQTYYFLAIAQPDVMLPNGNTYQQFHLFLTDTIPSPGATALFGLAGLAAVRRRRA